MFGIFCGYNFCIEFFLTHFVWMSEKDFLYTLYTTNQNQEKNHQGYDFDYSLV